MVIDPDVTLSVSELLRLAGDSALDERARESALATLSSFPEAASVTFSFVSREELVTIYESRAARHPERIELQELKRRLAQSPDEYVLLGAHVSAHLFVNSRGSELLGLVTKEA